MIKFISAIKNENTGTIGSYKKNMGAILSIKLAERMNNKEIDKKCKIHPDEESVVTVEVINGKPKFEIYNACCEAFRSELEYFIGSQQ